MLLVILRRPPAPSLNSIAKTFSRPRSKGEIGTESNVPAARILFERGGRNSIGGAAL